MRTIKFRGKRVDNGEWVYGDLVHFSNGEACILPEDGEWRHRLIIPDSVGQFTGWHDADGKEIYEGDVLDVLYTIHVERENVCVVFGNNEVERTPGFYFSDNGTNECDHTWDFREFLPDRKVIGNIHDNPELIRYEQFHKN